ncbi:hypothetical protein [uncultured Desulfovibrio sp.]|uniref:hypothetical protein n=1 Tax=uncultured Desulfovibrio sp. TaxID=167968 RepID=UPI002619ADA7|nr:hypothetical protein [uncultured Desulfovibrio sp.]
MARNTGDEGIWCPMGRISIQQTTQDGGISAMPAGGFNLVLPVGRNGGGGRLYFASTCFGRRCPFYRRGFNPWGWGRCALAAIDYRPWIAAVMLVVALLFSLWRQF